MIIRHRMISKRVIWPCLRGVQTLALVALGVSAAHAQSPAAARDSTRSAFVDLRPDGNGVAALAASITIDADRQQLSRVIQTIADRTHVDLTFDPTLRGLDALVTLHVHAVPAAVALLRVVARTDLAFRVSPNGGLVLRRTVEGRADTTALRGMVRDATSGAPLGDVHIDVIGNASMTVSRDDGTFTIRGVAPGERELRFTRLGYHPESTTVLLNASSEARVPTVTLSSLPPMLATVRVAPGYFGIMEQAPGTRESLSREQIQNSPQPGEDIFRAVNRLPGLAASDLSAKLFVRGGGADELYVTLDGVQLYEPYHLKDIDAALSIIDVETIRGIDLSTGGFSAEYGDHLTGVFAMRTLAPSTDSIRTTIGASVTNVRLMSQGGFGAGRGSWLVGARRGYLDLALRLTHQSDSLSPKYYDVFAKARYALSDNHSLTMHILRAGDSFKYLPAPDPSIASAYGSTYGWLSWEGAFGQRLTTTSLASVSRVTWDRAGLQLDAISEPRLQLKDVRSFDAYALKSDWTLSLTDRALLRWGAEAKRVTANYAYSAAQRRAEEGDGEVVESSDPSSIDAAPRGDVTSAYATSRLRPIDAIVVETGLRVDRQTYGVAASQWSPRASAAWTVSRGTTLRAAWGLYYQSQQPYELQVRDGVSQFYPAERARQVSFGIEQRLTPSLTARAEVYDRALSHLRPEFLNAFNGVDLFPELTDDRIRLDRSVGNARGLEVLLHGASSARIQWSANYTLARTIDRIGAQDIPRALDQRHAVYAQAAHRPRSNTWGVSADWVFHSGWPVTPAYFRIDTLLNRTEVFSLAVSQRMGALNAGRLPSYKRLDVRATRYFGSGHRQFAMYVDVFNVLSAPNPRGYNYDFRLNPPRIVRSGDTQIGLLPTAGLTWTF